MINEGTNAWNREAFRADMKANKFEGLEGHLVVYTDGNFLFSAEDEKELHHQLETTYSSMTHYSVGRIGKTTFVDIEGPGQPAPFQLLEGEERQVSPYELFSALLGED